MTPTVFATFKYNHADAALRSRARLVFVGVSLLLALIVSKVGWPVGPITLLIPLIAYFAVTKQLLMGPRYLLCGGTIVYFANVARLSFSSTKGVLQIHAKNGKVFVLEREKFPTSARKAPKIAINKAAKFDKVSGKIIEKVRQMSPQVECIGL